MKLLLDTHAFLFAIAAPAKLSEKVRNLLTDTKVERYVSAVSIWEVAIKIQIGKLDMPADRSFYAAHVKALKARVLAVEFPHSLAVLSLPLHHRDPFDRMLIAQAREEGLVVVTRDAAFEAYEVPTVW